VVSLASKFGGLEEKRKKIWDFLALDSLERSKLGGGLEAPPSVHKIVFLLPHGIAQLLQVWHWREKLPEGTQRWTMKT
jgi:hypothetical protein